MKLDWIKLLISITVSFLTIYALRKFTVLKAKCRDPKQGHQNSSIVTINILMECIILLVILIVWLFWIHFSSKMAWNLSWLIIILLWTNQLTSKPINSQLLFASDQLYFESSWDCIIIWKYIILRFLILQVSHWGSPWMNSFATVPTKKLSLTAFIQSSIILIKKWFAL